MMKQHYCYWAVVSRKETLVLRWKDTKKTSMLKYRERTLMTE